MAEPDPEDRYKVLAGVINIVSGVACIVLLLLLLLEVRLPDNVNNAIKALVAALFFAAFVYKIVLWVNRRDERRDARPSGLFGLRYPGTNTGMFAGMSDINPSRFASIAVAVTLAILAVLLFLRKPF
jgi:hypothetical protein